MAPPAAMVALDPWAHSPAVEIDEKPHYQSVLDAGLLRLREAGLAVQGEANRQDVDE